jgi:hypothetical protein
MHSDRKSKLVMATQSRARILRKVRQWAQSVENEKNINPWGRLRVCTIFVSLATKINQQPGISAVNISADGKGWIIVYGAQVFDVEQ